MRKTSFAFLFAAALAGILALSCSDPVKEDPKAEEGFLVSAGKGYTLNFTQDATYPDSSATAPTKLTDSGADAYAWDSMVGMIAPVAGGNPAAVIDLGSVRANLSFFGVKALVDPDSGVSLPAGIDVSVSNDKITFTPITTNAAREYASADVNEGKGQYIKTIGYSPATAVSGRYVKIEVQPSANAGDWVMLSEILVGAGAVPAGYEPLATAK